VRRLKPRLAGAQRSANGRVADADDGHHAAGAAVLGTVGEEAIGVAAGAGASRKDAARAEAGVDQLATVGFDQVEVQAHHGRRVAGRALIQEEHRVFEADGIGIVDLGEKVARICELGFEGGLNFFTDDIAAGANSRADSSNEILGAGAELKAQAANAALDDAPDGAAPAGMKGSHDPATAVSDQDGDAVGGHDGKEQPRLIGHQTVAFCGLLRGARVGVSGAQNEVGVDLLHRDKGNGGVAGHRFGQQPAVLGYGIALIVGGESKIKLAPGGCCGVGAADAAMAGAESVP